MHLKCTRCGMEFTVVVKHGSEEIDWTNGPYHCFACGGEAEEVAS